MRSGGLLMVLWVGGSAAAQEPGALAAADARDLSGEGQAFVEQELAPERVCVHQSVRVRVRLGFEREFFEQAMIQPFRRELDVPVQLALEWWGGQPDLEVLPGSGAPSQGERSELASLALGDELLRARRLGERERDGRAFVVFELERELAPTRAGEHVLPAPLLRFAFATRFEDDLFAGRVAVDRVDAFVSGAPLALTVLELPEDGRPLAFTDAVGSFTVRAEAEPRQLEVGESLTLALHVEGRGNLARFKAPELESVPGFRVQGLREEVLQSDPARRTFVFDLAPIRVETQELPALPFSFFDPGPPARYRTEWTDPIALAVLPPLFDARPQSETPGGPDNPDGPAPVEEPSPPRPWWLLALVPLAVLVGALRIGARFARRRARGPQPPPRARGARAAFESRLERPDVDLADALGEYFAAQLGCTRAAVIGPDLGARLERAGVPRELAARAAERFEGLVAAQFGGVPPADGARGARALVDELELAFAVPGARR